jgi:hypothetical protein
MVAAPMANLDPNAVLAKWKTNTENAAASYVTGAQNTAKDPTALAIAAIPYMRTRILAAIDNGVVANGLRRAGKQGWLAGVEGKGKANFSTGVANADTKFLAQLPTVQRMDNTTLAGRKARMNSWFDIMSAYVKA